MSYTLFAYRPYYAGDGHSMTRDRHDEEEESVVFQYGLSEPELIEMWAGLRFSEQSEPKYHDHRIEVLRNGEHVDGYILDNLYDLLDTRVKELWAEHNRLEEEKARIATERRAAEVAEMYRQAAQNQAVRLAEKRLEVEKLKVEITQLEAAIQAAGPEVSQ